MKKSNEQNTKLERKTHVISQLDGKDTPPAIKKFAYPKQGDFSK